MGIFRGAWAVVSINFHKWKRDYRVWLIFAFTAVIIVDYLSGYTDYAVAENRSLTGCLLPVLYLPSEISLRAPKMLWHIGFILLLCNAPFMYPVSPYAILRTRRVKWWIGECTYIILAALIFMVFVTLVSILVAAPAMPLAADWGETFHDFVFGTDTHTVQELLERSALSIKVPQKSIMYLNPAACQIYTFFTGWGSFAVLGLLLYLVNLMQKNTVLGLGVTAVFILLDPILTMLAPQYGYWIQVFSPVCWTSVENLHNLRSDYFVSIPFVAVAYPLLIIALISLIAWGSKKVRIEVR
ncbi:MAG: hypothetical protein J6C32_08290 [Eubacterium sp.]|nr:hypothetical protein [Eubacterium sp.]